MATATARPSGEDREESEEHEEDDGQQVENISFHVCRLLQHDTNALANVLFIMNLCVLCLCLQWMLGFALEASKPHLLLRHHFPSKVGGCPVSELACATAGHSAWYESVSAAGSGDGDAETAGARWRLVLRSDISLTQDSFLHHDFFPVVLQPCTLYCCRHGWTRFCYPAESS